MAYDLRQERSNATTTRLLRDDEEAQREERKPQEPWRGEYVKSIVYAGLDAIVTCFSLISSISAMQRSSVDVLVLGISNLVADGMSMGFGDFVSSSAEKEMALKERAVTAWEVANCSKPQQQDLVRKYQSLGMDINDASTTILIDEKMAAQKGIVPATVEEEKPWKNGVVTFLAFLVFSSLPLLSFIILIPFTDSDQVKFVGACVLAALALALLGIAKAKIAGQSYAPSVAITVANGAIAAGAAYFLGWALRNVAHVEGTD